MKHNLGRGVLYHDNNMDALKEIPDESVDCVVTDPPYSISFMGKEWDKALPTVDLWKEVLRVMKPGAFAFVMSSPRQDVLSRMICNLTDAGFETGFTSLYHTYASGFPKAQNISKSIDKRAEVEREVIGKYIAPDGKNRSGGTNPNPMDWDKPSEDKRFNITAPATDEAKRFDGAYGGYQPKPALEVILVCMKPLSEKTFVDQALKNGKGVTWLGDAKIPTEENITNRNSMGGKFILNGFRNGDELEEAYKSGVEKSPDGRSVKDIYERWLKQKDYYERNPYNESSRFPGNLLVSDDILDDGREYSSGKIEKHHKVRGWSNPKSKTGWHRQSHDTYPVGNKESIGDTGGYSRFFSLDAWFGERIKSLPPHVRKVLPFFIVPKASRGERERGCENLPSKKVNDGRECECDRPHQRAETLRTNTHVSVKPIQLMSYLITIGSREGDTILDPFLGSGTTAIAAEMLGRRWVGMEIASEYVEIAKARLLAVEPTLF